jgi:hypothetical protein
MASITKANMGLWIAGAGVALWAVDKATIPQGSSATDQITGAKPAAYGGSIYGPTGFLKPLTGLPIDPTVLLVVVGLGLWAFHKFGK